MKSKKKLYQCWLKYFISIILLDTKRVHFGFGKNKQLLVKLSKIYQSNFTDIA